MKNVNISIPESLHRQIKIFADLKKMKMREFIIGALKKELFQSKLDIAPFDDEPVTDEDMEAMKTADEERLKGELISWESLMMETE